ncbi:MAG: thioredoxin domain-containing protein, partial [Archangium sp.]|nr:thioredoxin domain-containing protein [Archangium sp.]
MNRLARERSPYLRQHAENPVDWYPWGPEALERAKREEKPILLSVGYSACHWCHVMAHESFEDPITAQAMNEHFVNVKVDREERPDVDQLYQGVVQLMGRGGGWPLTVFLTPSLRPFFGGTYFPQEPRHGLPSFRALVNGIGEAWKNERADLERESLTFEEGLREFTNIGLDGKSAPWTIEALRQAGEKMAAVIDPRHGGFGPHGPRFPNPMNLAFMLRAWRRGAHVRCRDGALHTLEKMCLGGVHDQLGGGFHRYSVDERWLVPHFEKMLYD